MTRTPQELGPGDAEEVRAAGVSEAALDDAIAVCFTFNLIGRVSDALGFAIPAVADFDRQAWFLLRLGYRL